MPQSRHKNASPGAALITAPGLRLAVIAPGMRVQPHGLDPMHADLFDEKPVLRSSLTGRASTGASMNAAQRLPRSLDLARCQLVPDLYAYLDRGTVVAVAQRDHCDPPVLVGRHGRMVAGNRPAKGAGCDNSRSSRRAWQTSPDATWYPSGTVYQISSPSARN